MTEASDAKRTVAEIADGAAHQAVLVLLRRSEFNALTEDQIDALEGEVAWTIIEALDAARPEQVFGDRSREDTQQVVRDMLQASVADLTKGGE